MGIDFAATARDIVRHVGGESNIKSYAHCATRLRFALRDASKADKSALEKTPGVLSIVQAGGQYQIVVGNEVPRVYAEIEKIIGGAKSASGGSPENDGAEEATQQKQSILTRFIELISSLFLPVLWPLAGAGLLKAFISLATSLGVPAEAQTTVILSAIADSIFYFLPIFLAVTSAKRFGTNMFTSMAIGASLVYPTIIEFAAAGAPVHFAGIPVLMMNYTSSVIPIIIAVWLQSYVEKFLNKVLPAALRNFMTPLLVLVVMVPFILMTVGPATTLAALAVSDGVNAIFEFAPWLAGAIMGGFWQVFVLFGLHWGLIPVMINDLSTQGYTLLGGPIPAAVLAQGAATLAVFIRTRSARRREVAGPSALSGILAGVTEPAIYGVNLPLKLPFYFGIAGGAVGGTIAALGGSANNAFVFPSLLGLPAYMEVGNFALQLIGCAVAVAIAFTLTFLFGSREQADDAPVANAEVIPAPADDAGVLEPAGAATTAGGVAVATRTVTAVAAVTGRAIALDQVPDKVFGSGVMGSGLGILPSDGRIVAPVSGTLVTAMASGHAYGIRSDEGVEVLVHVGIDTVRLEGAGFTPHVEKGQRVEAGQVLVDADLATIDAAGYDPTVIVVVTNTKKLTAVRPTVDTDVTAGERSIEIDL